jgi:hypothetical protein
MLRMCLSVLYVYRILILNQLADFHETRYERYATGGHP